MRIAFVSYEYPPDTAFGGISTYVAQVSRLLVNRGHDVSVFCATLSEDHLEVVDGICMYRVKCDKRESFHTKVAENFTQIHVVDPFDLVESPEYFGDALKIKECFPDLPLVVKLHTPRFLIHELTYAHVTGLVKIRYMLGGLRKGKFSHPFWKWEKRKEADIDYKITCLANQIHSPSVSLKSIVAKRWKIRPDKISHVPYPFVPGTDFLKISIKKTETFNISFIGRLEIRKGILELLPAMKYVMKKKPDCVFRLIGASQQSHITGLSMKDYILGYLGEFSTRIEFVEVKPHQIPDILAATDVCVFPSIWENFPNVCLEAMAAGRAIVASNQGGMSDMIRNGESGFLVNPTNPKALANAIICLLEDPDLRVKFGSNARQTVLNKYNNQTIGSLMEKKYAELL
ncbi:glycosyltransferase family 4 protein [Flavitalea antarctica]